ncbi:MAG: hypothetical protein Ct9H300mP1_23270 [Planctomycetaceae bacterium]|nr:MAG: hypothetical protein Ct9H300mP1_23270 [Planctomycetaceae bacterium]
MSVSWCDYNGDGRPDLYVGNMFSSAGERMLTSGGSSRRPTRRCVASFTTRPGQHPVRERWRRYVS